MCIDKLSLSRLNHTWLIDLDGTICKHNGYKIDGHDTLLPGVEHMFNSIPKDDFIIFITSRTKDYEHDTISFLKNNNIKYNMIIFDAPLGERIVINDIKPNGLKTAISINLVRDAGCYLQPIIDDNL